MTDDIYSSLYRKTIQSAQKAAVLLRQNNPRISERLNLYEETALNVEPKNVLMFRCIDGSLYPNLDGFYTSRTLGAVCDREILRRFLSLVAIKSIVVEVHMNCAWLAHINSKPSVEGDVENVTKNLLKKARERVNEPLDLSKWQHVDAIGFCMHEEVKQILKTMKVFKAGSAPSVHYRVAGCSGSCANTP